MLGCSSRHHGLLPLALLASSSILHHDGGASPAPRSTLCSCTQESFLLLPQLAHVPAPGGNPGCLRAQSFLPLHSLSATAGSCFEQCHGREGLLWDGSDTGMSWEKEGLSQRGNLEPAGEFPADLAHLPRHPESLEAVERLPPSLPSTKWKHDLSLRAKLPFAWRSGQFCSWWGCYLGPGRGGPWEPMMPGSSLALLCWPA